MAKDKKTMGGPPDDRLSPVFRARLQELPATHRVHAIVLLTTATQPSRPLTRQSTEERKAAIEQVRESVAAGLREVDHVLEAAGGERHSDTADALGSIAITTTPRGILLLADCPQVRAILEDQPVFPVDSSVPRR